MAAFGKLLRPVETLDSLSYRPPGHGDATRRRRHARARIVSEQPQHLPQLGVAGVKEEISNRTVIRVKNLYIEA